MGKQSTPKKGVTPPKGRPTRARGAASASRRVFGPIAQWIAVIALLILVFALLIILTDGGDFNPFDGGQTGALFVGQPLPIGSLSHWM